MKQPALITLTEWERCDPSTCASLRNLFLDDPTVARTAEDLTEAGILGVSERRSGLALQATSYVGRLQLGGLTVVIRPKISGMPLMQLLRYAFGLRNLRLLGGMEASAEVGALEELLVLQLYQEVEELLARGLQRSYVRTEAVLASPRGRIDVTRLATGRFTGTAALPCIHHPRRQESALNQALLAGVRLGAGMTGDVRLRNGLLRQAALLGDAVSAVRLSHSLLERAYGEVNRLTEAYRPTLTVIELLMGAYGAGIEVPERRATLPGFAFDMNRFFQALIGRFLAASLPGFVVNEEFGMRGVLSFDREYNPQGKRAPTPRPDFVVKRADRVVSVLDTKYRDLWQLDLPREMLYQLALYALAQGQGGRATIIYPTVRAEARESRVNISQLFGGQQLGQVGLRPVNLVQLARLIEEGDEARERFARELAGVQ